MRGISSTFRNGSDDDDECCSTSSRDEEENHDTKPPQVNAELEMKLRRYELKHVDLELKLSASEEKVSEAALVLEEAEKTRDMYRKQCNRAWEEVKELERVIEEERKSGQKNSPMNCSNKNKINLRNVPNDSG